MTVNFSGIHNAMYMKFLSQNDGKYINQVQATFSNQKNARHLDVAKPLLKMFPSEDNSIKIVFKDSEPFKDTFLSINDRKVKTTVDNLPIMESVMNIMEAIKITPNELFTNNNHKVNEIIKQTRKVLRFPDKNQAEEEQMLRKFFDKDSVKIVADDISTGLRERSADLIKMN